MYNMWPGCYSFKNEIKLLLLWFKEQIDLIIFRIYELDRIINS